MTDQILVPGPAPVPAEESLAAPAAGDGRKRRLALLGGVAGALLLAGGGYVLLGGGGSDTVSTPVAAPRPALTHRVPLGSPAKPKAAPAAKAAQPAAPAKGQPQALAAVPPTFTGTHLRDPFRPLVSPPPPPKAAAPTGPSAGSQAPTAAGATASRPADTGTTSAPAKSTPSSSHVVSLVATSGNSVTTKVDGATYTTVVGQNFAHFFKVVSVQGACATLMYGDTAFDLCGGHTVTLQ